MVWSQSWVVTAAGDAEARALVEAALLRWTPAEAEPAAVQSVRPYRGPDDLALAEAVAEELSQIQQTVAQGHRQELARRLQHLRYRALGIPPREGWVVLDHDAPRSPRPLDTRSGRGPRWVATVQWDGPLPSLNADN